MREAELAVWNALARYKFWMFGYHAARWVNFARLHGGKRANPFHSLVEMARDRGFPQKNLYPKHVTNR
ncbi:hypothetical protein LCGC14_2563710 [marine sediment metagenome]|uniref:Uncharacterized protein n=1 Tax=marine sediment metagenome TaxID=412755 RepID=A0A0F9AJ55_9ZZZZ